MKYIALAAFALIWAVPVSQDAGQPEQRVVQRRSTASGQKADKAARTQQTANSEATQAIAAAIAQANQQHADELKAAAAQKDQDIAIQGKLVKYTFWLVIVGSIQFVALIAQGVIFFFTLRIISRQSRVLQRQNVSMKNAVIAARDNATATRKNLDMLISKERPRIRLEMCKLKLSSPGQEFPFDEVVFKVFCYGTTPAFIQERRATVNITDSVEPPDKQPHVPLSPLPPVLAPSSEGIEKSALIFQHLDDVKRTAIMEGRLFVHFHGFITYRDVFDMERETRFRYMWKVSDLKNLDGSRFGYWSQCGSPEDNKET